MILVADVVRRLTTRLIDLETRHSAAEVKDALDDAALALVNFRPDANAVLEEFIIQPGSPRQILPAGGLALIDCAYNKPADATVDRPAVTMTAITVQDKALFDVTVPDWMLPSSECFSIQHYFYDPKVPREFMVYPVPLVPVTISIRYGKSPALIDDVAGSSVDVFRDDAAVIPLDIQYRNAIVAYALYVLLSKDDVEPVQAQSAMKYLNQFYQILGLKLKAEYRIVMGGANAPA